MKPRTLRLAGWLAASLPGLWLLSRGVLGRLGADPVAEILNQLGLSALWLLLASLACTPLSYAGWKQALTLRRLFGLFAFGYACAHLLTYLVIDQGLAFDLILKDLTKRRFQAVGALAFLCLLPLAITSTAGWQRRLGFHRWKALHRLAYLAGVLAVVHFIWRVKADLREPLAYAAMLLFLLGVRVAHGLRSWNRVAGRSRVVP